MYTIYQSDDRLWCLKDPNGQHFDGESYITKNAAQHSADLKNQTQKKVVH